MTLFFNSFCTPATYNAMTCSISVEDALAPASTLSSSDAASFGSASSPLLENEEIWGECLHFLFYWLKNKSTCVVPQIETIKTKKKSPPFMFTPFPPCFLLKMASK
jgi:hypothetical protein